METFEPNPDAGIAPAAGATVVEVTDETFVDLVIEGSKDRPVVVDFWAEWCAPCRTIGPVLERLADERGGEFLLAKLDVDANPQASAAFRIQGIPAVKAFRDGRLVDEFVGAIPESAIRSFIDAVVPSESDHVTAAAEAAERAGEAEEAERLFAEAFEADPKNIRAALGLARAAAEHGDLEAARALLVPLRPDPEAERLLAAIDVSGWAEGDAAATGPLAEAGRDAAEGRFAEALAGFLALVQADGEERDAAREAMVKLFAVLGDDDPLTQGYRRRLAAALF